MKNITFDTESGNLVIPSEFLKCNPEIVNEVLKASGKYISKRAKWLAGTSPEVVETASAICQFLSSSWILIEIADELQEYANSGKGCTAESAILLSKKLAAINSVIFESFDDNAVWLEVMRQVNAGQNEECQHDYSELGKLIERKYGTVSNCETSLRLEIGSIADALSGKRVLDQVETFLLADVLAINATDYHKFFERKENKK